MVARIKAFPEPPDWFSLDKYEGAEHFGLEQWTYQLFLRRFGNRYADDPDKPWEQIKKHGLVPLPRDPYFPAPAPEELGPLDMGSVGSLSCASVCNIRMHSEQLEIESGIGDDQLLFNFKPFDEYVRETYGEDILNPSIFYVSVDLEFHDQLIIEHFTKWLKAARKEFIGKPHRPFTKAKARLWTDARVLPYIDLSRWMEEKETNLTQEEIGDMLFPGQAVDTKRVQRTQQMAKQILTPEFLIALMHQTENYTPLP